MSLTICIPVDTVLSTSKVNSLEQLVIKDEITHATANGMYCIRFLIMMQSPTLVENSSPVITTVQVTEMEKNIIMARGTTLTSEFDHLHCCWLVGLFWGLQTLYIHLFFNVLM